MLEVRDLRVRFHGRDGVVNAIDGIDLKIARGEIVALVGESGSGKSMTAMSIARILPPAAEVASGQILLDGVDLLKLNDHKMNGVRGGRIAMLFQQPKASLDPTSRVGDQVSEAYRVHRNPSSTDARQRTLDLLADVGIPEPGRRAKAYAHQLSGGMAQRVMIAAALSGGPELLIADEPTTALDVTVQAQILQLLTTMSRENGLAMLLITHDLGIVSTVADRVAVMYAGKIVEDGPTRRDRPPRPAPVHGGAAAVVDAHPGGGRPPLRDPRGDGAARPGRDRMPVPVSLHLRRRPRHRGALRVRRARPLGLRLARASRPMLGSRERDDPGPPARDGANAVSRPLVVLNDVQKHFPVSGGFLGGRREVVHAVDGVSLTINEGEVLGLVGETGSGKSTLARVMLRLTGTDKGSVTFDGRDVLAANRREMKGLRREMQLIFQDPYSALDPRMRLGQSIDAPLSQHGVGTKAERVAKIADLLGKVGLDPSFADRYPSECSGGQLHRVVIARALSLGPRFLACDEPTSSLDASIRAQILNLLVDLKNQLNLTMLMISHDLRVVRYISDRVAVMYLGQIVELGDRDAIFDNPRHPYTRKLIQASLPEEGAGFAGSILQGEPPSPINPPSGCRFRTRCPLAQAVCATAPALEEVEPGHWVSCFFWDQPLPVTPSSRPGRGGRGRRLVVSRRAPGAPRGRFRGSEIGLMLATAGIHAGGWIAAGVAVGTIAPLTLACLRFVTAGALLLVIARWRRAPLGTDDWRSLLAVSLIGVALAHALFYNGLRLAPVADGVVLSTALTPTLAVLFAVPLLGERVSRKAALGVAISAVGVALIVFDAGSAESRGDRILGDALVIAGAVATALYTVIGRVSLRTGSALGVVASTTLIGGLALAPFALLESAGGKAVSWSPEVWLAFLYLTVPSAGLSGVLYYMLIHLSGAARASLVAYMVPVLVLAWSAIVQGEPLTAARVAGAIAAIVGVRIVLSGSSPLGPGPQRRNDGAAPADRPGEETISNPPTAGFTVRRMQPEDIPAARAIMIRTFEEDFGTGYQPAIHTDVADLAGVYLDNPRHALFVAVDDATGQLVATAGVRDGALKPGLSPPASSSGTTRRGRRSSFGCTRCASTAAGGSPARWSARRSSSSSPTAATRSSRSTRTRTRRERSGSGMRSGRPSSRTTATARHRRSSSRIPIDRVRRFLAAPA